MSLIIWLLVRNILTSVSEMLPPGSARFFFFCSLFLCRLVNFLWGLSGIVELGVYTKIVVYHIWNFSLFQSFSYFFLGFHFISVYVHFQSTSPHCLCETAQERALLLDVWNGACEEIVQVSCLL